MQRGPIGPTGPALERRVNTNPLEQSLQDSDCGRDLHRRAATGIIITPTGEMSCSNPCSMLNADCIMVRQGSTGINEAR